LATFLTITANTGVGTLPVTGDWITNHAGGFARVLRVSGTVAAPTFTLYAQRGLFGGAGYKLVTSAWTGSVASISTNTNNITFITDCYASSCYVENNIVEAGFVANTTAIYGIDINGSGGHTVSGNVVNNCWGTGIRINDGNGIEVTNNVISLPALSGISAPSASSNVRYFNNRVTGYGRGQPSLSTGYGLQVVGGSSNQLLTNYAEPAYYEITLSDVSGTFTQAELVINGSTTSRATAVLTYTSPYRLCVFNDEKWSVGMTITGANSGAVGTIATMVPHYAYTASGVYVSDNADVVIDGNSSFGATTALTVTNAATSTVGGRITDNVAGDSLAGVVLNNVSYMNFDANRSVRITNRSLSITGTNDKLLLTSNVLGANTTGNNVEISNTTTNAVLSSNIMDGTVSLGTSESLRSEDNVGAPPTIDIVKATNFAPTAAQYGRAFSCTAALTATLPTLATTPVGTEYTFIVYTTDKVIVRATAGQTVDVSAAGGGFSTSTKYASLTVRARSATEWVVTSMIKVWDLEA